MNNRGVTLVELLIVIVVLGVIAAFAIPRVDEIVNNSRISVDSYNVDLLNELTTNYGNTISVQNNDIFDGINTDQERMQKLVTEGFLSRVVSVQQPDASIEWDVDSQAWSLIGGEYINIYSGASASYVFTSNSLSTYISDSGVVSPNMSKWDTDNEYLENTTGETRIFMPISKNEYTITSTNQLSAGSNGGYGVFFDITLRNGDESKDDGYIFQFDRGYGDGAMIVRPRVNGGERGPVWVLHARDTAAFDTEQNDPDWWSASHTIKVVVTNVDENTRKATFFIDGTNVGSMEYDNEIQGEQIYTGFRGWGSSTTKFYSLDIS